MRRSLIRPLLLCVACTFACKGQAETSGEGAKSKPGEGAGEADQESGSEVDGEEDAPTPAAGGVSPAAFGGLAAMLKKGLEGPGPYDEPKQSEAFDREAEHWLAYELDGAVVERMSMDLFGSTSGTPLRTLTKGLAAAASNDQVQGLALRLGNVGMSLATAEELRDHLLRFKADGARKLACHAEGLGNMSMYLASACDELSLAPLGGVSIPGPALAPIHVKGLLDKLGVVADFIHVGAFKSGPEPLTHEAPSADSLAAYQSMVDGSYTRLVQGIASGRELQKSAVEAAIDQALFIAPKAKEAGLIDGIEVYEDFRSRVIGGAQWGPLKLDKALDFDDPLALQRFLGVLPPDRPSEPHVALVYAVGNVIDGEGAGISGAAGEIASRPLSAALRALAADEKVVAVVLRVDSPGGSALASEQIHLASLELAKTKPLVVSMGSLAASGGYYISAGATRIYAEPDTLTGSIGVFGGKMAMRGALESVGVKSYEVSASKRAMVWSAMDPWNEGERAAVRESMEFTYERFLQRVGTGRKMTRDAVHEVAQGRVWTGTQARERGLVDELGGLDEALAAAAELGKVEGEPGFEVYPPAPNLKDLLGSLGSAGVSARASSSLMATRFVNVLVELGPQALGPMASQLHLLLQQDGAKVWALSFTPAMR